MDEFSPILNVILELHLVRLESAETFLEQRIQGLQAYVVAVAILSAYTLSQAQTKGILLFYRILLSLATAVVLLFQMYWSYYAYVDDRIARKYLSELTQFVERNEEPNITPLEAWPLGKRGCFTKDGAILKGEKTWMFGKLQEINHEWSSYITTNKIGEFEYYPCTGAFPSWRILWSVKQINMWTISLLIFFVIAYAAMGRVLQSKGKE